MKKTSDETTEAINPLLASFALPETVEVQVGDTSFRFRTFRCVETQTELEKKFRRYVRLLRSPRVPAAWKPYLPLPDEAIRMVFFVCELSVEPKLSDVDCLWLAQNNGFLLSYLYASIAEANAGAIAIREQEELEQLGED